MKTAHVILGSLFVIMLAGCDSTPEWQKTSPEDAFRRVLLDWMMGKPQNVVDALVEQDQQHLKAAHASVVAVLPEGAKVPKPHEFLVASGVSTPFAIRKMSLYEKLPKEVAPGQQARIKLEFHDGREGEAIMVWDGSTWRLQLGLSTPSASPSTQSPG